MAVNIYEIIDDPRERKVSRPIKTAGSAGSKYGVVDDGIPLKKISEDTDTAINSNDATKKKLKDIRPLLQRRKVSRTKSN